MKGLEIAEAELQVDKNFSVTLYRLPPNDGLFNLDFWEFDRKLLILIEQFYWVFEGIENKEDDPFIQPFWMQTSVAQEIQDMFGIPNDHKFSLGGGFSSNLNKLKERIKSVRNALGRRRMSDLRDALIESLQDYAGQKTKKAYMIVAHEPNNPNHIYMTMSIRLLNEQIIEHRHIQQSVRALLEPAFAEVWGYKVTPVPQKISIPLHSAALELVTMFEKKVNQLQISPLLSMREILKKEGIVSGDGPTYKIYGQKFRALMDRWANPSQTRPGQIIGLCFDCKSINLEYKCSTCDLGICCNKCFNNFDKHFCQ